ncbi:MAG: ATP-grasp domain-containing protein [Erysipelotrichaceae bacterium]|nr:ATP-grasp domain-containing protein [Erysipelotrichaceae bacterium]
MKKLLVIGAGFLQDFVIQKAVSMGYETLAVDADPTAIGFAHAHKHKVINIIDEEACLSYAKQENINGVLTAATDFGVLTASYIAKNMGLPGLNYEVAKLVKNKYLVRKCLFEHDVDDSEQAYEVNEYTDLNLMAEKLHYPVMVKPCDGSGSRGANRVDKASDLMKACEYAMNSSITNRAEIESFIDGREYGAESLVINGKVHVLAIMKKWMTDPPYYAELGHAIPCGLDPEAEKKAKECVIKAIKALGINTGSVNMDMLITKDGKVYIVDIGARMGGNMIGPCVIPYGTGIDYVGAMIQNTVGDSVDLMAKEHTAVATKLLAFDEGTINRVPDINLIEKEYGVEIYHHMFEGMHVNEYRTNLDGCGYIVAKGQTAENAEETAKIVLNLIKKEAFKKLYDK